MTLLAMMAMAKAALAVVAALLCAASLREDESVSSGVGSVVLAWLAFEVLFTLP